MAHGKSVQLADPEVVKRLMEHLTDAFERFASGEAEKTEEGLRYVDGLMGCHNFYKRIILDLEHRVRENRGCDPPAGLRMRDIAVATLRESLKV